MTENTQIKLFEDKKIRTLWDKESEEWYFSVVDVVAVLTESKDAPAYWRKLKQRLKEEGNETVTNCHALKMPAPDGKMRLTDCLNTEQLFRLIQSIPSPKAEPFKLWMAQVAKERIDEMQDPEQGIQRALAEYRALGYSANWINQRLKSIEIRKDLTDKWKKHGLKEGVQFATLTDIIYKTWAGKTAKEYKEYKGLKKENLRDIQRKQVRSVEANKELVLNMLAELSTKEISESTDPKNFSDHVKNAVDGASIKAAGNFLHKWNVNKLICSYLTMLTLKVKVVRPEQIRLLIIWGFRGRPPRRCKGLCLFFFFLRKVDERNKTWLCKF